MKFNYELRLSISFDLKFIILIQQKLAADRDCRRVLRKAKKTWWHGFFSVNVPFLGKFRDKGYLCNYLRREGVDDSKLGQKSKYPLCNAVAAAAGAASA